jgi:hypothetical protein
VVDGNIGANAWLIATVHDRKIHPSGDPEEENHTGTLIG